MTTFETLKARVTAAIADKEVLRLIPGLDLSVNVKSGRDSFSIQFADGQVDIGAASDASNIHLSADDASWATLLQSPPPPTFQSFTALQLANPAFDLEGDPISIARARAVLERIFEQVGSADATRSKPRELNLSQISGYYKTIVANDTDYEIYYETAGAGVPVLFLHTAGADSRQFMAQLGDSELAAQFRMIAVDLPFHGRSMPPRNWDGSSYKLTAAMYRTWCSAIINQIVEDKVIVVGGSMGAAMSMVLAAECPGQLRGIIAVEPPFQSKGRKNPYQFHVGVHGGLHNSAYVRGLMSPTSPLSDRRRASWIYSQGAPGIYPGDLSFYSEEFDGAEVAPRINASKTPVVLLSGTYDYSATPADGAKLAKLIPASLHIIMEGLGHFPMCEDPNHFFSYLKQGLDFIKNKQ